MNRPHLPSTLSSAITLALLCLSVVACGVGVGSDDAFEERWSPAPLAEEGLTEPQTRGATSQALRIASLQASQADADASYAIESLSRPNSSRGGIFAAANNDAQGMGFRFEASGPTVVVRGVGTSATAELSVALVSIGRGLQVLEAPPVRHHEVEGFDVRYDRGTVLEWYRNGPVGLEQGFELSEAPLVGDEPLALVISVSGALRAELRGQHVALVDERGAVRARYGHLFVRDTDGNEVPSWMEITRNGHIRLLVDDDGATYPLSIDPFVWLETAKLIGSDTAGGDTFGQSVALSANGEVALVSAPSHNSGDGAIYAYELVGGVWQQQQKLVVSTPGTVLGLSVDLSGDGATALIGAHIDNDAGSDAGAVYVFENVGGTWVEQQKLTASDAAPSDFFGGSLTLSADGNTACIGAWGVDDAALQGGAFYMFARIGGVWVEHQKLLLPDTNMNEQAGQVVPSLSADGTVALLGKFDGSSATAYGPHIYTLSGGTWVHQQQLTASDAYYGDAYGVSAQLSADGSTALVGASDKNHPTQPIFFLGAAYLFTNNGGTWVQQQKLTASDASYGDSFGYAGRLSADGSIALISAIKGDGASADSGAAYMFERLGSTWVEQDKLTASDGGLNDWFGVRVDLSFDGSTAIVGANADDDYGTSTGSAYVFGTPVPGALGDACAVGNQCASGFCVDGVCCDGACGGNSANDCLACTAALTAGVDGTCGVASLSVTCRAAAGTCDVAETCDGVSSTCPADAKVQASTVCRPSAGACDIEESCNGTDPLCPADSKATASSVCRPSAGACDVAETCDGASDACPADAKEAATTVCRVGTDACDVEEICDGVGDACPPDAKEPPTTVCRPATGPCDVDETCDGANDACPADAFMVAGTACRPAAGSCDLAEACDGVTASCPADVVATAGTVCRPALDTCDAEEQCDGASLDCPADASTPDGTSCDDGDSCTAPDQCQAGTCIAGVDTCNGAGGSGGQPPPSIQPLTADEGGCTLHASTRSSGHPGNMAWLTLLGLLTLRRRQHPCSQEPSK